MRVSQLDLSIIIIAFNEEQKLPRCLQSLPDGSEVIVVDSHSQDQTTTIAEKFGARVYRRAFTNFQEQKNYALSLATRRWVLSLDADEVLDPTLHAAIVAVVRQDGLHQYRIRRRLVFMNRTLRFGRSSDQPIRLFQREGAVFRNEIHEYIAASGSLQTLPGVALHYSYDDLTDYFARFNRYTSAVATQHFAAGKKPRFALLVLRPWWEFVSRYLVRGGFLDGYPGYTYALLSSLYAYTKYAKLKELVDRQ